MAVDEQHLRIRRSLEETLGVEEASYLMDRPVGGWSELVTNQTLGLRVSVLDERFRAIDARFAQVDARFAQVDARFAQVDARFNGLDVRLDAIHREIRDQSWKLMTAVIAGMATMGAVFGGLVAVFV